MISPELTFAAMTRRSEPNPRLHTVATNETSRARTPRRARLHPTQRWLIALAYARGVKVVAICAEHGISMTALLQIVHGFGLRLRGKCRRPARSNPEDVEHLRRWARRKAEACQSEARDWAVIAELE